MKSVLLSLATALVLLLPVTALSEADEPTTKKVCVEQRDPKTQKPKQVCKTIKVHKKLDGTPVPPKK